MKEELNELNMIQEEINAETGGMSFQELQGYVGAMIDDTKKLIDDSISPDRAKATEYYRGEKFGNEEDGRSSVVDMTVRDTVGKIMPALMRTFFGGERVVEFIPQTQFDVPFAEAATDYVNYVLNKDNNLYMECQAAWEDALVRKTGIIKYYYEEMGDDEAYQLTGLDEVSLNALMADPELQVNVLSQVMTETGMSFSVHVTRMVKNGRVKIKALPCEEFLIDRDATTIEDAIFTGHRRMATVSELVQMGYDFDLVESKASGVNELDDNVERRVRNPAALNYGFRSEESVKLVEYVEAYMKVDFDNDGVAELRKICCMGTDYEIVHHEAWSHPPFAVFSPIPEAHVFFGTSIFDLVGDIQLIKSNVLRNSLDSLSLSIHPRMVITEGQVNVEDVENTEIGAIIRQDQPGAVQSLTLPYVGKDAFPMLGYLDSLKEGRTGISKASMGLDAENLQSTTAVAVNATIQGAQAQMELIARNFAEIGMRQLYTGVLKLLIQHQDYARMVRLREEFVPIDPRAWNSNMDVSVNVPIGGATEQEKMSSLQSIMTLQENIIQKFGINNPLVSLENYRNTINAAIEMAGFKNVAEFVTQGPVVIPPPQPQPPSADELLVQAQREQIQAEVQMKAAELELKRQQMVRDDDFRQDKLEADVMIDVAEIKAKFGAQITTAEIQAMMDREREQMRRTNTQ